MISTTPAVKEIFYKSSTVKVGAGCTIEYNMNTMLDNITISTPIEDSQYKSGITTEDGQLIKVNPFKKLFPIDSIVKPFRPLNSGIKYLILSDEDNPDRTGDPSKPIHFADYRQIPFPSNFPRVYYAGVTNYYKYWLTPQNTGVNLTVKYSQDTVSIVEAYSTGPNHSKPNRAVYKTSVEHGFTANKYVKIDGPGDSSWNSLPSEPYKIIEVPDSKTFVVNKNMPEDFESFSPTKTATLVDENDLDLPTKTALSNKIVIKFEKFHALPSTCSVTISYADGTSSGPTAYVIDPTKDGSLILYLNSLGSWTTSLPYSSSANISYPAPKEIKSISLTTPSAGVGKLIAVTEVSARWVMDVSNDLVSLDISKESTSDPTDLLPVGNITANSISLNMARYNQQELKAISYNRDSEWISDPQNYIYLTKNAELKPYFKVFHSTGAVTDGATQSKYDILWQGSYYIDSHRIDEYGNIEISAIDGAKQLMDTIIPDMTLSSVPVTSVIMSMLDSIGFSNYSINILLDEEGNPIDKSIPNLSRWWSENDKTVWASLQELCRDIQMNAYFDENNVLQFYSRDLMYQLRDADWEFYHEESFDNKLPNIISFDKEEVASANQVKVIWRTPMNSLYTQNATDLWSSEPAFLISGGLKQKIEKETPAELVQFYLDLDNLDPIISIDSTFNYSGYFLVGSEIFEYDAMEFKYLPVSANDGDDMTSVFVSSQGEWSQYRSLSKTGSQNFKPTGRYRIKKRGAFGTDPQLHEATGDTVQGWYQLKEVTWY